MLASLSTVVFTMVRRELAFGEGAPLGSISAGIGISKISFLWSKEFAAICFGDFSAPWKRLYFVATIFLCTVLGVSVAPASATAMQPVKGQWPAGGTDIWLNSTADQMFPSVLNDSHTLGPICAVSGSNNECPSAQWQTISRDYLSQLPEGDKLVHGLIRRSPVSFTLRGRNAMLNVMVDVRAPVYDKFTYNFSVASVPHVAMADAIVLNSQFWDLASGNATIHNEHRFSYKFSERFTMDAPAPLAFTMCKATTYDTGSLMAPAFHDIRYARFPPVTINDTNFHDWITSTAVSNRSRPDLFWFDLPTNFSNNASLGAVASIPINDSSVQIWGCMIDARWANTTVDADRLQRKSAGTPPEFHGEWMSKDSHPRATIRPSFAQYLNPRLPSSNSTVFQEMAISSGLWDPDTLQGGGTASLREESHLETILNLMVVNGMARTAPYTTQQGNIIDLDNDNGHWWRGFMPTSPQVFGPGGNAYDVTAEQQESFYRLHMHTWAEGYAYSTSSASVMFSIIILFIYVAVAVVFMVVSVCSGFTSTAWESPIELMALALASPELEDMKSMAAGVSTIEPLRKRYCVVEKGEDRIELTQWKEKEAETDIKNEGRVIENKRYGGKVKNLSIVLPL